MMTDNLEYEKMVLNLMGLLDTEAEHLGQSLVLLDELRGCVIRRKDDELEAMIEKIRVQSVDYQKIQKGRDALIMEISLGLGIEPDQVNLSLLKEQADEETAGMIASRQERLKELIEKLKREYLSTAMLLKECSRINNNMLRALFAPNSRGNTYDAKGKSRWNQQRGLISCKM